MRQFLSIISFFLLLCSGYQSGTEVASPNGKNTLSLTLDKDGALHYQIRSNDNLVVQPSTMGIVTENKENTFSKGLVFVE